MKIWAIRAGFAVVVLALGATSATAQYPPPTGSPFVPYQTSGNYQPDNMYNRSIQPLSPYLNLLRGGNPAVNYYYGVRPGLPSGGYIPPSAQNSGLRPIRPGFLPTSPPGTAREAIPPGFEYASSPKETTLNPAGHPVQYANTGGYSPGLNAPPRPGGFTKPQQAPTVKKP